MKARTVLRWLLIGGVLASLSTLPLAAALPAPNISRQKAVRQACAFAGFAEKYVASATQAIVSDPSAQVFVIEKRPVWEVTFERVYLTVSRPGEKAVFNPTLHTVIVWVDANTGALLKLFTPPPKAGGLLHMVGQAQRQSLAGNGYAIVTTPTNPARPFLSVLATLNTRGSGVVTQANEIVAYYGSVTRALGTSEDKMQNRPAWIVFFGGVDQQFTSGGPAGGTEARAPAKATEAMLIVDAVDHRWYGTWLSGGPAEKAGTDKPS